MIPSTFPWNMMIVSVIKCTILWSLLSLTASFTLSSPHYLHVEKSSSSSSTSLSLSTIKYLSSLSKATSDSSTDSSSRHLPESLLNSFSYQSAKEDTRIEICAAGEKGYGAFAKVFIPANTFLGYYVGEMLTQAQVDARYYGEREPSAWDEEWIASRRRRNQTLTGNYMFDVSLTPEFRETLIYVDGEDTDLSGWCRFLNHAFRSDPRCNAEPYLDMGNQEPKIWFGTIRDIYPGEEICIDYGEYYWTGNEHLIR